MSELESMLNELNRAIAQHRAENGGGAVAVAAAQEQDDGAAAQQASQALAGFLLQASSIQRNVEQTGTVSAEVIAERNTVLAAFVGSPIVPTEHSNFPPLQVSNKGGSHGHGHGAKSHGGHGQPAGSGHGHAHGAGNGNAHGTGNGNGGGLQQAPATGSHTCECGRTVPFAAPAEGAPATVATQPVASQPAPAPTPVTAPVPVQPASPPEVAAVPISEAAAATFPWKKHISVVETSLRNKDVQIAEALLKLLNDVAEVIAVEVPVRLRMSTQLSNIRIERGDIAEAQRMLVQALQSVEGTPHKKSVATAFCLDALAQCFLQQEKFDQAEKTRRTAVIVADECLGAEHPDAAYFRERLDNLRQERAIATIGEDEASRTLLDKLTDEYNARVAAGQQPETAEAKPGDSVSGFMFDKYLSNGKTALNQKNWREAENSLRSAVDKGQGLADSDPRKCEGYRTLAVALEAQGKLNEAKELYQKGLTLAFKFIGWNDIQVAHCLAALAELHNKEADVGCAKNYYKQAIAAYTVILGKDHETTAALQTTYNAFLDRVKEERKWKQVSAF